MPNLRVPDNVGDTAQVVADESGNASALSVSKKEVQVNGGTLTINNRGDGKVVLQIGTERAWAFKQRGSGPESMLELTTANPENKKKHFIINTDGSVAVGDVIPQAKLHVDGSILVTQDVILAGADCAEEFNVETSEEPGTVLVIGSGRSLRKSTVAYDRCVAGVVSGGGDTRPGIVLGRQPGGRCGQLPVALNGTVYCLVDADEAPIEVGDLLTTSHRPGHAMKARDYQRAFGAVLGKSMGALDCGVGLLPILVALQ